MYLLHCPWKRGGARASKGWTSTCWSAGGIFFPSTTSEDHGRNSPIRHLGTHSLGVTGSPVRLLYDQAGVFSSNSRTGNLLRLKSGLEAIQNGETNVTSDINVLLEGLQRNGNPASCNGYRHTWTLRERSVRTLWQKKAGALRYFAPLYRLKMQLQSSAFCPILSRNHSSQTLTAPEY